MSYIDDSFNAQRFEASSSSTTITTPPTKPRQSRLRASCDGCFLAKVKCSKARPICARCLSCGADCKYSPSSRAGKPRSDGSKGSSQTNLNTMTEVSMAEEHPMSSYAQHPMSPNGNNGNSSKGPHFSLDTDWSKLGSSQDTHDRMARHSLPATLTPSNTPPDAENQVPPTSAHGEYDNFAWNQVSRPETAPFLSYNQAARSKSDANIPQTIAPWFEAQHNFLQFQQQSPMSPHSNAIYNTTIQKSPACTCFATCLQALQALHNGSSPQVVPPFDVVLTVNRRAVESCSMMLNCPKCLSKSGASTSTMLLATVIGKIMSFYRAASQSYFGFSPNPQLPQINPLPLTFGTYRVAGEDGRWLEMEILLRELRKLEELFGKFQETCQKLEMEDDLGVNNALTTYLGQSLHFTYEVLNMQKEAAFS